MIMILAAIKKDIPRQELLSPKGFPVESYMKPVLKTLINSRLPHKNPGRNLVRTIYSLKLTCLVSISSSMRKTA